MTEETAFAVAESKLTPADFERVRDLIYRHVGINLPPSKRTMVFSRLSRRLRETGHDSFNAYLDSVAGPHTAEWQHFVNALTTNLTSFFREAYHFPVLAEFLKSRPEQSRPPSIWCAAASTGEEPYSLAITVIEALGARSGAKIFASDIDTNVLNTARRGVYPVASVDSLEPAVRNRYFMRGVRENAGFVRVRPELGAMITFDQVNLSADEWPFREPFDVIFCRNVMIYFDTKVKSGVLERMHRALRPGGLLFVGHSENFTDRRELFALQGKTVYRRVG
ncbi:MAG: methyltransferase domain-containing protein [Burkholderiaceae bacterium]|nr:methyltransferase domain-containing protein [Burkholderiaceae bacterium]